MCNLFCRSYCSWRQTFFYFWCWNEIGHISPYGRRSLSLDSKRGGTLICSGCWLRSSTKGSERTSNKGCLDIFPNTPGEGSGNTEGRGILKISSSDNP